MTTRRSSAVRPLTHRGTMRATRLPTAFPCASFALLPLTDEIACPCFSSCRIVPVRATEPGRVFLVFCVVPPSQQTD